MHRLLLLPGPHRDIPLQAAFTEHQEEDDAPDPGERPLPAYHAAASRDDPAGEECEGQEAAWEREPLWEGEAQKDKELHQNLTWLMLPRRILCLKMTADFLVCWGITECGYRQSEKVRFWIFLLSVTPAPMPWACPMSTILLPWQWLCSCIAINGVWVRVSSCKTCTSTCRIEEECRTEFLAVQWLGLQAFTAEDVGLIPSWETKIPASHTVQPKNLHVVLPFKWSSRFNKKKKEHMTKGDNWPHMEIKPYAYHYLICMQHIFKNKICRNTPDKNR